MGGCYSILVERPYKYITMRLLGLTEILNSTFSKYKDMQCNQHCSVPDNGTFICRPVSVLEGGDEVLLFIGGRTGLLKASVSITPRDPISHLDLE